MQTVNELISIPQKNIPRIKILFLNFYSLIGTAFFTIGIFFVFIFSSTLNKSSFSSFSSNVDSTEGQITEVTKTTFGFGGEGGGGSDPIYKYSFRYFVNDSVFINNGYSTGVNFTVNNIVTVKYKKDNPSLSKVDSLKTSHYGLYVLFTVIFPIIGLWLLVKGLKWGNNFRKTLEDGILTEGTFQKVEAKDEYYKHYYRFFDLKGAEMTAIEERNDSSITETIEIIYNKLDSSKSFVLNRESIPLVFGRNKILDLINCR